MGASTFIWGRLCSRRPVDPTAWEAEDEGTYAMGTTTTKHAVPLSLITIEHKRPA